MHQLAVSALGRDRPGIVAAITRVLVAHRLNVADAQMGILSGRFSMTLIVEALDDVDSRVLRADLERVAEEIGLDTIHVHDVGDADDLPPHPTRIVTVYGVDHPGIVHAVAAELAARNVNITDLNTRRVAEPGSEPLYAMMLEVAPPPEMGDDELEAALRRVAGEQQVEVSVRELEDDLL